MSKNRKPRYADNQIRVVDPDARVRVVGHVVGIAPATQIPDNRPGFQFSMTMPALKVSLLVMYEGEIREVPLPGWTRIDSKRTEYVPAEERVRRDQLAEALPLGTTIQIVVEEQHGRLRARPDPRTIPAAPKMPSKGGCIHQVGMVVDPPSPLIIEMEEKQAERLKQAELRAEAEIRKEREAKEKKEREDLAAKQAELIAISTRQAELQAEMEAAAIEIPNGPMIVNGQPVDADEEDLEDEVVEEAAEEVDVTKSAAEVVAELQAELAGDKDEEAVLADMIREEELAAAKMDEDDKNEVETTPVEITEPAAGVAAEADTQ